MIVRRAEEALRKLAAAEKDNPSPEPEKPKVVPKTKRGRKRKAEEEASKEPVELTKEKMAEIEESFAHFIATSTISLSCVENPRMEKWLKEIHPDVS